MRRRQAISRVCDIRDDADSDDDEERGINPEQQLDRHAGSSDMPDGTAGEHSRPGENHRHL